MVMKLWGVLISIGAAVMLLASQPAGSGSMTLMGVGKVAGALTPPTVTHQAENAAAGSTVTLDVGAGDIVVLVVSGYTHTAPVTASGASLGSLTSAFDATLTGQMLWVKNTGAAITGETITVSPAPPSMRAFSISGAAASPFDGSVVGIADPNMTSAGIGATVTVHGALIVAYTSYSGSTDSSPWTSGFGNAYGDVYSYRQVTTAGSYTATFGGGAAGSSGLMFAVKGQ